MSELSLIIVCLFSFRFQALAADLLLLNHQPCTVCIFGSLLMSCVWFYRLSTVFWGWGSPWSDFWLCYFFCSLGSDLGSRKCFANTSANCSTVAIRASPIITKFAPSSFQLLVLSRNHRCVVQFSFLSEFVSSQCSCGCRVYILAYKLPCFVSIGHCKCMFQQLFYTSWDNCKVGSAPLCPLLPTLLLKSLWSFSPRLENLW